MPRTMPLKAPAQALPGEAASPAKNAIAVFDFKPAKDQFRCDVLTGLGQPVKRLHPKYFYDQRGSLLFEQICEQPEYYLTRTERELLRLHAVDMATLAGDGCIVFEYGSGNSRKIRCLLDELRGPVSYVAIDISRQHLVDSVTALAEDYPEVRAAAICADIMQPLPLPPSRDGQSRRVGFFPGSSIGNFSPVEASRFLRNVARTLGPGGILLIGVDTKKSRHLLDEAYNDRRGVTAAFNLNLLVRINRELGADFRPECFMHLAWYNEESGRVEMHLVSTEAQSVTIGDTRIDFAPGESIHTENSYKYTIEEFQRLAVPCGYEPICEWTDAQQLFSIHALMVQAPPEEPDALAESA